VARASIAVWRLFADLDLGDARLQSFRSLHACFTRELKPGARPVDADPRALASPCDAIVGACGAVDGTRVLQAKGFPYTLQDLLVDPALIEAYRDGQYVTLRLTSSMYHRFHAPYDGTVEHVTYISGDTFNVNPIALRRVASLFCKNERAVIRTHLATGEALTLIPVAAILVASIRLHCLDVMLNAQTEGPTEFVCDTNVRKGDELGWFEHGSTIIMLAPEHFEFCDNVAESSRIRAGEPLMRKSTV
jgi:phosphatidylserine decarboxylase